jgi:hypothetical protein
LPVWCRIAIVGRAAGVVDGEEEEMTISRTVGRTAKYLRRNLRKTYRRPAPASRSKPDLVLLGVAPGVMPSGKPPVRIFLGTEPAQQRAERIFVWSVEKARDPSRVYEIHLMKDLIGFNRWWWTTGFTNYRLAIPHLAGGRGRAIYNDVDQIYLADPGELFDADMRDHGFLAIAAKDRTGGVPFDSSVMLIDCERMNAVWTLAEAQTERKSAMLNKVATIAGLWGRLAPEWNARDSEYVPGRSKLIHYTKLKTQPWQPFPNLYDYRIAPEGQVWLDLERSADAAGYQVRLAAESEAA